MILTIHEMIFQMHLEKQSYDKAVDEIKNVFNLMRIQLQKIQEAMGKIRRNALNYSVRDYEEILLENLCAFYDVGEHNEMKLHGADWNDAMDMAWENGESVAFTCAYAGNMKNIAEYLRKLQEKEMFDRIEVAEEMEILFTGDRELYESPEKKQQILMILLLLLMP